MFHVFMSGGNYLPSYCIYLARAGHEGWFLWNSFIREGVLVLIYL
jgi:hypothetical protein